jgi:hypothetical protein
VTDQWRLVEGGVAALLLVVVWALAVRVVKKRDGKRILQQQFAAPVEPGGPFTVCKLLFPPEEGFTPCVVRATQTGWYMFSPEELRARRRGILQYSGIRYLAKPVFIPWNLLEYRYAKFPLRGWWLRFDVPSANATFFVRHRVALELLRAAGRPLPSA